MYCVKFEYKKEDTLNDEAAAKKSEKVLVIFKARSNQWRPQMKSVSSIDTAGGRYLHHKHRVWKRAGNEGS